VQRPGWFYSNNVAIHEQEWIKAYQTSNETTVD